MDRKSKIVLVIGILLSVAGLVSLVGAFDPDADPCAIALTSEGGGRLDTVYLPTGCSPSGNETVVTIPSIAIQAIQTRAGAGGGY